MRTARMPDPPPKTVRYCRCGRVAFLWSDGAFRCTANHVVAEELVSVTDTSGGTPNA